MAKDKSKEEDAEDADDKEEKEEGEAKEGEEGGEGEEGEGEGAPKKRSKKKVIIMGVLALLLLVGGAAGAYFSGLFGKHEEKASGELMAGGKVIEKPIYYTMPEFLVNLNSGTRQVSFLKTTVVLELASQKDVPLVEANAPRLRDAINTYLHELRASDLAGSSGILRLREELLLRANKILAPVKIKDVLFSEIIVQ